MNKLITIIYLNIAILSQCSEREERESPQKTFLATPSPREQRLTPNKSFQEVSSQTGTIETISPFSPTTKREEQSPTAKIVEPLPIVKTEVGSNSPKTPGMYYLEKEKQTKKFQDLIKQIEAFINQQKKVVTTTKFSFFEKIKGIPKKFKDDQEKDLKKFIEETNKQLLLSQQEETKSLNDEYSKKMVYYHNKSLNNPDIKHVFTKGSENTIKKNEAREIEMDTRHLNQIQKFNDFLTN